MNLKNNHHPDKTVSAYQLFKGEGVANAIQILQGAELKEHITKIPALLMCVSGEVVFENEKGVVQVLQTGDYISIEPFVKHRVVGNQLSQLILLK